MVSNPNKYSEMGTGSSLNDIRDDDDFPHVGISFHLEASTL